MIAELITFASLVGATLVLATAWTAIENYLNNK